MSDTGGGGGTSTQYVKSETSNLPEYAKPYFTNLMERGNALLSQPYVRYDQDRIVGFNPQQLAVQKGVAGMQTPGQFGQATDLVNQAGLGSLAAAHYAPGQFNAQQVAGQNLKQYQMEGPGSFTPDQAQKYMSPYMEAALEPQRRQAVLDAKRGQLAANLGAARQGTYGGSGELIASMDRERMLGQQMGDIEARGRQAAFEQAQQQFNTEQNLGQQAAMQNLQAQLGVQGLGAQQALQAQLANQQYGLEAQRLGEQSRQFGAQQALQGYGQAGQLGQTMSNIGSAQQQADISRYGLQNTTAAQQQALQQQYLDMHYQDFLRQRDYPLEMLQQYSSLLHGVPVTPTSTTTSYVPSPSVASQILGTGLGALGMYNSLKS
jgi:hypothetical protein